MSHYMTDKLQFNGKFEILNLLKTDIRVVFKPCNFSLLSFSFSFEKEKGKKITKESKKKDRGRLGAARRKFAQKARANFVDR